MADEFQVEIYGVTAEEWPRVLEAVQKVGSFGHKVLRNGDVVIAANPLKLDTRDMPTTGGTAPQIIGSKPTS